MKYNVKFSCGHEEVKELFGSYAERERKVKYFEEYGECSECYKAKKAAELSEKSAGLPELEGTEKQVAWAKKIRVEKIESLQETLKAMFGKNVDAFIKKLDQEGKDTMIEQIKAKAPADKAEKAIADLNRAVKTVELLREFKTTTSAKWIIENR